MTPKQILIAPLDWGLGHTTRCVPLIRYLQALGHHPVFAGNASQQRFIKDTFGVIDTIDLEGYNVSYSRVNRFAQAGLLLQLPALHKAVRSEHAWLQRLAEERQIDGVISDNRYGLHHSTIPSVIMTHQLMVQSGMGKLADHAVQRVHYTYLQRFGIVWVPDIAGAQNLAGLLAHPEKLPEVTTYMGLLSRFADAENACVNGGYLLVLLSGPEPARTAFSALLWQQVQGYKGKVIFVEGSDDAQTPATIPRHITYYKRVTGQQLAPLLTGAETVICRSGYSTIMDLAALRKRAILIPTPGQTEQEYIARHLGDQGIFYWQKERDFNLHNALSEAERFPYNLPAFGTAFHQHQKVIADWTNTLT